MPNQLLAHEYEGPDSLKPFMEDENDEYRLNAMDEAARAHLSFRNSRGADERLDMHNKPIIAGQGNHGAGVTVINPGDEEDTQDEERHPEEV